MKWVSMASCWFYGNVRHSPMVYKGKNAPELRILLMSLCHVISRLTVLYGKTIKHARNPSDWSGAAGQTMVGCRFPTQQMMHHHAENQPDIQETCSSKSVPESSESCTLHARF